MTKKTRDWLFRFFVFLFVVITIVLSLYATGYRFNLSWPLRLDRMLLKTGTLALDTKPKGATVTITSETKISSVFSLFGSKTEQTTPVKIKNLLPGEYVVSFTLDNYWPYQKKLRVNPEQTTFLEDVVLFRKSLPLNVFQTAAQDVSYSLNGRYAWLQNDKTIINLETEQKTDIATSNKINWLDNGKQIADGSKIINLDTNTTDDYTNIIGSVQESQLAGNSLIYLANNNLSIFDIKTKATALIPAEGKIIAYKAIGNIVFLIINNDNKTEIRSFDINNKKIINSSSLLNSKNFSFNASGNSLILTDDEHKIAYLLTTDGEQAIKDIIRGATIFKWLDNNKLAYASESELYIYDLAQTKSYLITRLSEKINSLSWSTDNYLIYSTATQVGTVNLTSEGNDITVLWQGNSLSSLYFNNKTGVLYFSGAIGQQSGLYKMTLK